MVRLLAAVGDNAYNDGMATLNIRNLPDEVHRELRQRAARHNRSMEAEARAILGEACRPPASPEEALRKVRAWREREFGPSPPENVVDDFLRWRRTEAWRE
jgi:plasmid stability protein